MVSKAFFRSRIENNGIDKSPINVQRLGSCRSHQLRQLRWNEVSGNLIDG